MTFRTRFAPSPTGPLHLGHAYSAMFAHDMARTNGGEFLVRIEDIDRSRCRSEWEELIYDDLCWLGVLWDDQVIRQSARGDTYAGALDQLASRGLLYACGCNRRDVMEAASAPHGGPLYGPDGVVYPGTCRERNLAFSEGQTVLRLDMSKALDELSEASLTFEELGMGPEGQSGSIQLRKDDLRERVGDVVLARRDMGTSYHLSVVVDDAAQAISHIVRGQDLFEATCIHVVLALLLGFQVPKYHHHGLIRDEHGKRLAKRDDARAIRKYREDGATVDDIRGLVGLDARRKNPSAARSFSPRSSGP